ncbi:MAG: sialidase family protein [Polyangiaceae bacterium]
MLGSAKTANANGRFPSAGQLVVSPSSPSHLVLRTTFGILISNDTGQNWDWLCEKAVGYGAAVEDPSIAVTGNDGLLVATFEGLGVSPDHGCSWSFAGGGLDKALLTDVAIHPDSPGNAISLVSSFASTLGDGGFTYKNQIFGSNDNGTTWNQLGQNLDDSFVAETLDAAKSDPQRIYISGIRGQGTSASGVFLASTDAGKTFTASTIALLSSDEHAPYIGAVDPVNANRVYVRTSGATSGRLLVTDDGGTSFRTVFSGTPLMGFAVSPDGSKVFVGDSNGLYEASSTDLTFAQKSNIQVQCLATTGTRVYACSVESSGFIVGASDDDGKTFAPLLHLSSVRGPLACAASTTASLCVPDWPGVAATLGADAGSIATDAGNISPPNTSTKSSSGCGCDLASKKSQNVGLAALLTALGLLLFRRKTAKN